MITAGELWAVHEAARANESGEIRFKQYAGGTLIYAVSPDHVVAFKTTIPGLKLPEAVIALSALNLFKGIPKDTPAILEPTIRVKGGVEHKALRLALESQGIGINRVAYADMTDRSIIDDSGWYGENMFRLRLAAPQIAILAAWFKKSRECSFRIMALESGLNINCLNPDYRGRRNAPGEVLDNEALRIAPDPGTYKAPDEPGFYYYPADQMGRILRFLKKHKAGATFTATPDWPLKIEFVLNDFPAAYWIAPRISD